MLSYFRYPNSIWHVQCYAGPIQPCLITLKPKRPFQNFRITFPITFWVDSDRIGKVSDISAIGLVWQNEAASLSNFLLLRGFLEGDEEKAWGNIGGILHSLPLKFVLCAVNCTQIVQQEDSRLRELTLWPQPATTQDHAT